MQYELFETNKYLQTTYITSTWKDVILLVFCTFSILPLARSSAEDEGLNLSSDSVAHAEGNYEFTRSGS